MKNIPFIKPTFPTSKELVEDYVTITDSNFYTNSGPFEKKFEKEINNYIGNSSKSAVVVNATIALILSIKAIIGEPKIAKKEIIIQSFTFAAGAEAIIWCGFEPVFIDIEEDSWQANIEQTKTYLLENSKSVAAILLCNTFGVGNVNISDWEDLAKEFNLPLIIDSAAGFGSEYTQSEKIGVRGDCEIFSMHATKPFAVGEGGLVVSKNYELIEKVNQNKNFGFNNNREVVELGLNGKAPEITSAIGLRQLSTYAQKINKRQQLLDIYKDLLKNENVKFQKNDSKSTISFVSLQLLDNDAKKVIQGYIMQKIEVRNYYNPPLHKHPLFKKYKKLDLTVTEELCSTVISLPLHDNFNHQDIQRIINVLKKE